MASDRGQLHEFATRTLDFGGRIHTMVYMNDAANKGNSIKVGDRVAMRDDGANPTSGDVLKVSKDGKRARVQFPLRGMRDGELTTQWTDASMWVRA